MHCFQKVHGADIDLISVNLKGRNFDDLICIEQGSEMLLQQQQQQQDIRRNSTVHDNKTAATAVRSV